MFADADITIYESQMLRAMHSRTWREEEIYYEICSYAG